MVYKKKKGKLLISHRYNLNALATFLSWGSYKGADRIRLTRCKNTIFSVLSANSPKFSASTCNSAL